MWLFVFFDLPTLSREQRRKHTRFRNDLEKLGFARVQLSVYICHFASEDATLSVQRKIQAALPPHGHVRMLLVTDRQFGKMLVVQCREKVPVEQPPPQVLLF
jgi:CRISPR-associated protein Cas2